MEVRTYYASDVASRARAGDRSTLSSQESFRSARDVRPRDFQASLKFVSYLARNKHTFIGGEGKACQRVRLRSLDRQKGVGVVQVHHGYPPFENPAEGVRVVVGLKHPSPELSRS
mgnify:CR=1 FL=1